MAEWAPLRSLLDESAGRCGTELVELPFVTDSGTHLCRNFLFSYLAEKVDFRTVQLSTHQK